MIQTETLTLLEWPRLCQQLATFAATKLGATAARQMSIPDDRPTSEHLQAQTQEAYHLETLPTGGLSFDGIHDIGEALERAALKGVLTGIELVAIASTLAGMRQLRRTIASYPDLTTLNALVADLRTYPELEQTIYHSIEEQGRVSDRASVKLAEIRERQRRLRQEIYQKLHNIMQQKAGAIQEATITQRHDRFVIPVKAPQRDAISGTIHDTSTSGATLYVEPSSTVAMNNQFQQLLRQEQAEEEAVRRRLTEQVAEVVDDLELLLATATTLDLATTRARYSLWLNANPPQFIQATQVTTLRQLRHPLLVWQQQHEQGHAVVPIDVMIQPHTRVVAITGPNTGGKTATLKTLGLAALMAKAGLFIPAREPVELPWFEQILADIGDEQSLQQSLSTFSGHIRRIGRILEPLTSPPDPSQPDPRQPAQATPGIAPYLILLDEVGAGTDPSEGTALAIALLQYLADRVQLTIATTHFGELKALKYQDDRFENASVEFDDTTLSPTYRLLWGIPGRSNALAIARRLGLTEAIIDQAQTYVGGLSQDVNQVISGLEAQRRAQEEKAKAAADLLASAERFYHQVSDRAKALQAREQSLQVAQEQAIQQAIAQAKADIATVIRQLQQGPATAQRAQQATEALADIAQQHLPSRQAKPAKVVDFVPKVGDRIRIPSLNQVAEVIDLDEPDRKLVARFGMMKVTVTWEEVESLDGKKVTKPPEATPKTAKAVKSDRLSKTAEDSQPKPQDPMIRTSRNTIDLRGSRVADAEIVLDNAIAEGDRVLWIIHGHGTGKLRQGVHDFLKQHRRVDRFTLAEHHDGGSGVTIAYLEAE